MSEPTDRGFRTLAIRLPDELHSQLVLIAGLDGQSLTDTIRQAIQELIDRKRDDGGLAVQAAKALEEMEHEAQIRRQALQALLGPNGATTGQPTPTESPAPSRGRPRRNGPAK